MRFRLVACLHKMACHVERYAQTSIGQEFEADDGALLSDYGRIHIRNVEWARVDGVVPFAASHFKALYEVFYGHLEPIDDVARAWWVALALRDQVFKDEITRFER